MIPGAIDIVPEEEPVVMPLVPTVSRPLPPPRRLTGELERFTSPRTLKLPPRVIPTKLLARAESAANVSRVDLPGNAAETVAPELVLDQLAALQTLGEPAAEPPTQYTVPTRVEEGVMETEPAEVKRSYSKPDVPPTTNEAPVRPLDAASRV